MAGGRRSRAIFTATPEQIGDVDARKKIAEADALQKETDRRQQVASQQAATPVVPRFGRVMNADPNRYAYAQTGDESGQAGRLRQDVLREREFAGFFHPRSATAPARSASPAPEVTRLNHDATPFNAAQGSQIFSGGEVIPTETGTTLASKYGTGSSRNAQQNELVQPYLADKSGDITHTILSKTPGEDPNLDPVYAANVFRKAGDEKTALAYEKHAGAMNPSQFTGPNGAQWNNPHYLVPNDTISPKATALLGEMDKRFVQPYEPGGTLASLATPPSTEFKVPPSLASIPAEETFAGKPLSAISDISSSAPVFPSGEFLAGQTARGAFAAASPLGPNKVSRSPGLFREGAFEAPAQPTVPSSPAGAPDAYRFGAAGRPPATATDPLFNIPEFTKGFAGGASTAAGVSRATAADFQQPTKANPLPTTPTTPEKDVGAIRSFAGLDTTPPPPPPPQPPPPPPVDDRYVFKGF